MATQPSAMTHTPLTGALTFRRHPKATGVARVVEPWPCTEIKMGRKVVGILRPPNWHGPPDQWTANFMIRRQPTKEDPRPFTWRRMKHRWDTENQARAWLEQNFTSIRSTHDLYAMEPD